MENASGRAGLDESFKIKKKLIDLYYKKSKNLDNLSIRIEIEKYENELKKDKFQPNYDTDKKRYISYAEYVLLLEAEWKQTMFNIRESTGDGNYKAVELWTNREIEDYLIMKNKQIQKLNAKLKNGK